ncbi:regulator of (H+)-ATPase in vacuolar membrane [Linderina pennispora]|nr:regulator of (H+)-ATPase in vacuolar membrane [Linderina pennispora]
MALRSVYTGRANMGTLAITTHPSSAIAGQLFSVYASGHSLIVHGDKAEHVVEVRHATIRSPISCVFASRHGQLAAVSGANVAVFQPSEGTPTQWAYASHLTAADETQTPTAGAWLGEDQILLGSGDQLVLWQNHPEMGWSTTWQKRTASRVSSIAVSPDASMFATTAAGGRLVKVWHAQSLGGDYTRFQYIAHSSAVRDIVWRQGRSSQENPVLYTVTRDGRFNVWTCSGSGTRFALIATADLARERTADLIAGNRKPRRLVVARVLEFPRSDSVEPQPSPQLVPGDCESATRPDSFSNPEVSQDQEAATPTSHAETDKQVVPEVPPAAEPEPESVHVLTPSLKPKIRPTRSRSRSALRLAQPPSPRPTPMSLPLSPELDYVYAAFSDGSFEMWEIQHSVGTFAIPEVQVVLRTPPINTSFPAIPKMAHSPSQMLQSLLWRSTDDGLCLAVADTVGHVYIFNVPKEDDSSDGSGVSPLRLVHLWDGHKEPVFHISVDPYSQRVATHSVEGELLIWDNIVTPERSLPISRRMELEGGRIRTIAWAPNESEFIGATDKSVYRLVYGTDSEQWSPCDTRFPQMDTFDHIFTYPSSSSEPSASPGGGELAYFISTINKSDKAVQTWRVAGPKEPITFVDRSVLKQAARFDRASRVMPVAHPFFSRDNIMVTFDTDSGHMRIWGIRTSPKFRWFCSKKHHLPKMEAAMIRYNSIDKAAIVSVNEDGSQVITIWVFSSASRASHYLPAGTIYPHSKDDKVCEIRWYLTEYAQSYLGIQWADRIDIYCQERNLDNAWLCISTIHASEFGSDTTIGSFSFTAAGEPTFSIGRKLIVYSERLPDGKRISEVAYEEHGELPYIHPSVLTELMSWGQMSAVKSLLAQLYDYIRERDIDPKSKAQLPSISLQDLIAPDDTQPSSQSNGTASKASSVRARYSVLFNSGLDDKIDAGSSAASDFAGFNREKADYIVEKLAEMKLPGISPLDQARLMSIVSTLAVSSAKDQPLDGMGTRYLIKLQLLELENKRLRTRQPSDLAYRELNWAMHSNSQAILLQICLQQHAPASGMTWEDARRMGIFLWLNDISSVQEEVEKMARNIFIATGRDPTQCGIFFLALKKPRLLLGLWRTAHTHPEQSKMLSFLSNDFAVQKWKTAAAKNAYVLLSRQRYLDAATFFLLSGKLVDAATVCVVQLKDIQLAVTICRCYEGDNGPVLRSILWNHVLPAALSCSDRWLASLVFGHMHKYDLVLRALTDSLPKLAVELEIETTPSTNASMSELDTELLMLYRSMINYSAHYRAPLVTQAELIAQTITIFECLGLPVMSLVVLEWWRRELFERTKASATAHSLTSAASTVQHTPALSKSASQAADQLSSGQLDMSSFGAFGMSAAPKPKPAPTVDPMATGMLDMSSFGSFGAPKPKPSPAPAADPVASGMLDMSSFGSVFAGFAPAPASNPPPLAEEAAATAAASSAAANGATNGAVAGDHFEGDSSLVVEIEDTPVQYTCRVTLALQMYEYIVRTMSSGNTTIDLDKEKKTISETLRLPISIFPATA